MHVYRLLLSGGDHDGTLLELQRETPLSAPLIDLAWPCCGEVYLGRRQADGLLSHLRYQVPAVPAAFLHAFE